MKLKKTLLSHFEKFNNEALREAGKYSLALLILINVVSAIGFYVEGELSKNTTEQALLGFNERIENSQKSFVPEINEIVSFIEIAEIELPTLEVPAKKNIAALSVKENNSVSRLFILQSGFKELKKIISESFDGMLTVTEEGTKVALAVAELEFIENEVIKNLTAPEVAFLKIAEIELPSLETVMPKEILRTDSDAKMTSDSVALTLQSAIDNVRKIISQTFEKQSQNLSDRVPRTPSSIDSALFESEAVSNSQSVRVAQNNLAPSLAPVISLLRSEVARYVELEFAARESVFLATIRNSITRQSDGDSRNRSTIVTNITQNADFSSPDITGGTITGAAANLASLSGAGLTNCESNNVLTWADGQFGCETDDSGGDGGGSGNSKWATSTPTTDITPNSAIGVVMTRSTTTNATTTTFFSSTASSTNLFATALTAGNATLGNLTAGTYNGQTISSAASLTGTLNVTSGLTTLSNALVTGSSTLQNLTFVNATGSAATTTNFFATNASTTDFRTNTATIGTLTVGSCVGCGGSSASTTLLSDSNTFSGANIFNSITRSTTTAATTTRFAISSITSSILKTAADGSLLAATVGTDYENILTFGDGLTRTANDADCDTASITVFGCLLAADWGLFNNKVSTTSIDTIAEVETLWSVSNILIESDIDASSELLALIDDETGAGALVFGTLPSLAGFISTASSTVIGNFNITGNSTSTNATTTNLSISNNLSVGSTAGSGDSVFQLADDTDAWSLGYYSADKTFRIASSTNLASNVYFQIGKSGTTTLSSGLSLESGSDEVLCIDPTTFEITRGGASCAASSLRFKEEIENLSYGLEAVRQLRPVSYQYKESERPGDDNRYLGFIAEEMIEVIPEVVERDGEGLPGGIDYAKLAPVFAKAMQEMYDGALSRVHDWLADATNGLTSLFAKKVNTEMLCVKKSDGSDVCVTGDQLSALLSSASLSASVPVPITPDPELESEPELEPELELPETAPESDLELESEPELPETDPEPAEPEVTEPAPEPAPESSVQ